VTAAWLGPHLGDTTPVAVYGVVLLGAGMAYWILTHTLIAAHVPGSRIAQAIGRDAKGYLSLLAYVIGIALAMVAPWLSIACYVAVAVAWFLPDRRVERVLTASSRDSP
jgi:uncharacterized membrane protein